MLVQYTSVSSLSPSERAALLASVGSAIALEGREYYTFNGKTFHTAEILHEKRFLAERAKGPRQTLME